MIRREDKYVYFVRAVGGQGAVKIGCSGYPKGRLLAFQAWSPVALELLAECKGWNAHEQLLHAHFIADRSHGEWFNWSPELQAVIDHVREHGALPAALGEPPKNHFEWKKFHSGRAGAMVKGTAQIRLAPVPA